MLKKKSEWESKLTPKKFVKQNLKTSIATITGALSVLFVQGVASCTIGDKPVVQEYVAPQPQPVTIKDAQNVTHIMRKLLYTPTYVTSSTTTFSKLEATIDSVYTNKGEGYGSIKIGSATANTFKHRNIIYISGGTDFWQPFGIDTTPPTWVKVSPNFLNGAIYPFLHGWVQKTTPNSKTTTLNNTYYTNDSEVQLDNDKVVVFKNTITTVNIKDEKPSVPIASQVGKNLRLLGHPGRLAYNRNHDLIITR